MKDQRTKVKLWYSPKTPLHGGPKRKPKKKKRELPPPQTKQKKKKTGDGRGWDFRDMVLRSRPPWCY
jgi:hypothetical protein